MSADESIVIELTVRMELAPEQVWPDGDVPESWTPEAVVARVEESGSLTRFNADWTAEDGGAEVGVHAQGRYARGWLR